MNSEKLVFEINLDEPKDILVNKISKIVSDQRKNLKKEGQIALNFLFKKKGEKDREVVYNLSGDEVSQLEKDFVFPKVVEGVIQKEFGTKIAKDPRLMEHLSKELKNDPYWSGRVVDLIKTLKEK